VPLNTDRGDLSQQLAQVLGEQTEPCGLRAEAYVAVRAHQIQCLASGAVHIVRFQLRVAVDALVTG
jgi:hypothetical protein